jgi:hypothetical protein
MGSIVDESKRGIRIVHMNHAYTSPVACLVTQLSLVGPENDAFWLPI